MNGITAVTKSMDFCINLYLWENYKFTTLKDIYKKNSTIEIDSRKYETYSIDIFLDSIKYLVYVFIGTKLYLTFSEVR